jgi:hypothetical protein
MASPHRSIGAAIYAEVEPMADRYQPESSQRTATQEDSEAPFTSKGRRSRRQSLADQCSIWPA